MRRTLIATIALVLVLAACGSSSKKSSSSTTTVTPKTTDTASDRRLAEGAVLTASDAPAGFTVSPHKDSGGDIPEQLKRDFANCMHADITFFDNDKGSVQVDGPDFKNPNTQAEISNSIEIVPNIDTVNKQYQQFENPDVEKCLAALFQAAIKEEMQKDPSSAGIEVGKVQVDSFAVNDVPDRGKGFRLTVPITAANGDSGTLYMDIAFAQRGRGELTIQSQNVNTPPNRDEAIALLKKMSDRLGSEAS